MSRISVDKAMNENRAMPRNTAHTTTLVSIRDSVLLLRSEPSTIIAPLGGVECYVPATILDYDTSSTNFGDSELKEVCDEFRKDDVWTEDFLELLILQCPNSLTIAEHVRNRVVKLAGEEKRAPVGPYVVQASTGRVYGLFKLFEDASSAFLRGTIPDVKEDRYKWLACTDRIAVPSRLYYSRQNGSLPLRGMRFGVKDSIDVAGLETGCGSKCYRSFHPGKRISAAFVSQLISAGAVLVGKMRCTQWCDGQDPLERLEEVSPINPRGDAFQKPSSSSSGSASGVASYPWLDFAIGTDTGGSIRYPAGVNGLYGVRPSLGSVKSTGLICSEFMDTPGVFARSASIAEIIVGVMGHQPLGRSISKPDGTRYKLLYAVEPDSSEPCETPVFFPRRGRRGSKSKTAAWILMESFVKKLEEHLRCQRHEICLYDLWKDTRSENTEKSLTEATNMIYQNIVYHTLWYNTVRPFVQEYQAANSGRMPFIEAITKARLEYGANVSSEDYESSVAALDTYATWVNEVLLPSPYSTALDTDTGVIPLLIYPQSWGMPHYRDEVTRRKNSDRGIFWDGFSTYSISYCSGCPDATIPLGDVEFRSRITQTEEYLPVAVSILTSRGEDQALLKLITDLEENGILRPVGCGSRL